MPSAPWTPPQSPRRRGPRVNRRPGGGLRAATGVLRSCGRRLGPAARALARAAVPVLAAGAACVLALAAGQYVVTGPYFRLRQVEADGLRRLGEADILRAAGLELNVTGTLGLDANAVARAITAHPWVEQARVEVRLPDRLRVRIRERVPAAIVVDGRGNRVLTDDYGERFAPPERPSDLDLPVVTGPGTSGVGRDDLRTALAAVREWRRQGVEAVDGLSEVRVDPTLGLTLYALTGGTAIQVSTEALPARLARVREVLAELRRRGERADYVLADDGRDRDRIVVRAIPWAAPAEADASETDAAPDRGGRDGRSGDGKQG